MVGSRLIDAAPPTLLERTAELAFLEHSVEASAGGQARLVVIEGEPGIGKSSLVRVALARADERGMRVLRGAGGELETAYAYGIALDLFSRAVARDPRRTRLLSGAAAHVAPVLSGQTAPAELRATDPFPIMHGFYWLVANLAERQPLVLAVDDAHWADLASLRMLGYLAERLADLPVLLVVAAWPPRSGEPVELGTLRGMAAGSTLRPAPLSTQAVRDALADAGHAPDAELVAACRQATHGNPFYLRELIRQLDPSTDGSRIDLLAPDEIVRRVTVRLTGLGPAAVAVARAVALLGAEAELASLSAMVGASLADTALVVDRLTESRVLEGGDRIGFVHPIVRSAVYRSIPAHEQAVAHRNAAAILARAADPPLDAIAGHLLATPRTGDPWVVDLLQAAARSAAAHGDPAGSVASLRRALDEPPEMGRRAEILVDLGRALALTGDALAAAAAYAEARGLVREGALRAAIAADEGEVLQAAGRFASASEAFSAGLGEQVDDPRLLDRLHAGSLAAAEFDRSLQAEAELRAEAILDTPGGAERFPLVALWVAYQRSLAARGSKEMALALVRRAIERIPIRELQGTGGAVELAHATLLSADELDADLALLTAAMREAQAAGSLAKYAVAAYCRAWPNLHTGRLADALADAQAAVDALDAGWEMFYPAACSVLALALAERNEIDAAESVIDLDRSRWGERLDYLVLIPSVRARLFLARGDVGAAAELLEEQESRASELGVPNPALSPWRSWLVVALTAAGEPGRARRLAEEQVEVSRGWGAARQLAAALRGLGVAVGGAEGIAILREALDAAQRSPARLEQVRVAVELGVALRVAGRRVDARRTLAEAADVAERLGAAALAARAVDELRALGARPRRIALTGPASLTPSELRVVELAAAGRSNREVAQALFVTRKAVEYHLANAYPKLGISSRRELPAALRGAVAGA
ncbi:MAG: helix-turn-helix transcriptional regulator [Candidatus Limnocylindria bacterium]